MTNRGFRADPKAIKDFAIGVAVLAGEGESATKYAREHIFHNEHTIWRGDPGIKGYGQSIPETGFLFSEAMKELKELYHVLGQNYQNLWQAMQASQGELELVAKYYETTDVELARRLDRHYGEKQAK